MCGRFTLRTPLSVLAKQFEFDFDAAMGDARPRYNIAPTQTVFAVRQIEQGARRELAKLFWGLIPSWAKDNKGAPPSQRSAPLSRSAAASCSPTAITSGEKKASSSNPTSSKSMAASRSRSQAYGNGGERRQ